MFGFGNSQRSRMNRYEPIPDHDHPTEIGPSNDDPKKIRRDVDPCGHRFFAWRRRVLVMLCFFIVVAVLSPMLVTKRFNSKAFWEFLKVTKSTDAISPGTPVAHHETLPTLLSLVQMNPSFSDGITTATTATIHEFEYVYALDNPYYDFVTQNYYYIIGAIADLAQRNDEQQSQRQISISWSIDGDEIEPSPSDTHSTKSAERQQRYRSQQQRPSMLIQWQSALDDEHDDANDLLLLLCSGSDENQIMNVLEVATLPQVRSTHRKAMLEQQHRRAHPMTDHVNVEYWYVPNVPSALLRQSECYWVYYYCHDNDNTVVDMNSKTSLDIRQYIPIGISNRYQMSKIQNVLQPTNIHIALTSQPDQMIIQFTTGGSETKQFNAMIGTPIVEYNEVKRVTTTTRVSGTTETYTASDMCQEPANVTGPGKFMSPGNLHTVLLSDLQPNTMYTYRVGIETGQGVIWNSHSGTFQTAIPAGDDDVVVVDDDATTEFTFLVYGDQGCPVSGWEDGQLWMEGMVNREVYLQPSSSSVASSPVRMIHHVGDLSYAQGAAHIWDAWLDMIQPISMYVPIMISVGNHEYDHMSGGGSGKDPSKYVTTESGFMPIWGNFANDSGGECGVPTSKRFTMPNGTNDNDRPELHSNGVFWYWYDYGLVRTIVVSSEHDLSEGSIQHVWLEHILFNTNRTITPWVIVELHRPLYEMEEALFPNPQNIGIAMRYEFEDLLHDYNVDIVFSGHFHTYHRTYVF